MYDGAAVSLDLNVSANNRTVNAVKQELWIKDGGIGPEVHHPLSHAEVYNRRNQTRFADRRLTREEHVANPRRPSLRPDLIVAPVGRVRTLLVEASVSNVCCPDNNAFATIHQRGCSVLAIDNRTTHLLRSPHLPMPRNVPEPGDSGGFERDGGVEATGDGAMDDGLLLLVEQCYHLALRPDRPLQPPVCPIQKAHNRRLLVGRREHRLDAPEVVGVQTETAFDDARL